jgi:pimeloyl-ACP methyl ester carboxylesterase
MTDLAFDILGEPDKPPLLLVHGMLSSRNHWHPNLSLAKTFRLIRVELPAHGCSPSPEDPGVYTPDALVESIERLREHLAVERWALCGQSFGAGITLRYALAHPERVTAQVFTNGNAAFRSLWSEDRKRQHAATIARIRTEGLVVLHELPFHPARARRFPPDVHAVLAADADRVNPKGIAMLFEHATPHLSVKERFTLTRPPTLLVNGRWEKAFQPVRDWIAEAAPTVEIVDLDGGHSINIERPEAFNAAASAFLLRHSTLEG